MLEKKRIRKQIIEERNKLSKEFISLNSNIISEKIQGMELYKNAETILLYMNFGSEVITEHMIIDAFRNHKKVAIPKIVGDEIEFYYIDNSREVVRGVWRNTGAHSYRGRFPHPAR